MSGRNAALRRVPRLLALLCVLSLAFGADAPDKYKGVPLWLLRPLFAGQARAATVGPFRYTAQSKPYNKTAYGVPLRCVAYVGPGHVVVVCVVRKKTSQKA